MYVKSQDYIRGRKCRSTTRAPNNVMIKRPGEIKKKCFKMTSKSVSGLHQTDEFQCELNELQCALLHLTTVR